MIWYRHWLEMRQGLLFLAGWWLFLGIAIAGPFYSMGWDSWRAFPWEAFDIELAELPLAATAGDSVFVWSEFAGRVLPFAFLATLTLAGTGVDSLMSPSGSSAAYTLTLPVSRARLVWTRLVAALAIVVAAGALAAAASSAILLARGTGVPLGPVAESLALGVPWMAMLLAVMGALLASVRTGWAFLGFAALFAATIVPISYTVASPARSETPWGIVAACLGITVLALAFTVSRASAREY